MKILYILVLFLCSLVPLIVANHRDLKLYQKSKSILIALLIPATVYVAWDIWATDRGHWSFNPDYILGVNLFGMPIEEVFFFLCVGFISIFTYEVIKLRVKIKR